MSLRFPLSLALLGVALCLNTSTWAQSTEPETPEPTGILRLSDALHAALLGNPELAPYSWDMRIADARIIQAGLRPNPVLSTEIENISLGGDPSSSGRTSSFGVAPDGTPSAGVEWSRESESSSIFGQSEITLRLSQLIELGGKRAARVKAAERGKVVAAWDYDVARYEVVGGVVAAFVDLLAAQEHVRQFQEVVELGEQLADTVSKLVAAGNSSPLERRRAVSEVESLRIELRQRENAVDQARIRLASLWGSQDPAFERAEGNVENMPVLPPLALLLEKRDANPLLARWTAELAHREAVLDLERSRAVPDLEVGLGYRASGGSDSSGRAFGLGTDGIGYSRSTTDLDDEWQHSVTLEFSIPLPLFDRNQGARKEAAYRVEKTAAERRATINQLDARLAEYYAVATNAFQVAASLRESVIPDLQKTFTLTQEGYRGGKFDFLTVLDAERQLIDAQLRATDAATSYHKAIAALEQTLGAGIVHTTDEASETYPPFVEQSPAIPQTTLEEGQ